MALWTLGTSPVEHLPIAHPQLIGYAINGNNWIFAAYTFQPSYRLILQREGFSGDLLGKSDELDELTDYLERPHVETVYQLVDQPPDYWFDNSVRSELEHLILSGKIQVFKVSDAHAIRLADRHDPIYSNPNNLDSTGNTLVDMRNELAEALGNEIMDRWVGKDKADRIHFDRWWGWRETVELYDVGEATFDVVAGLITGLIDLTKFVITVVGDTIELAYNITMAQGEFATKLARGDFDAAKEDLRQLGVAVEDVFKDIETLKAQVEEGASLFKALISDPYARDLIADYLDSLYQSIEYRESRVIGVKIVAAVGLEVLLVLATAGAGNAARWAGQAASKGAQAARAGRVGPFSAKAIDLMADLARLIKQRGMKSKPDAPEVKVVPEGEARTTSNNLNHSPKVKQYIPEDLEDAIKRLSERRREIAANGYQNKYSDAELAQMAKTGSVSRERYQVRFMEKSYLNDRNSPDVPLSGKMGGPFEGTSGKGVKYWSTSFDQLEDADTDPKLISEKIGIKYKSDKKYALVIVDNQKAATISGSKSITPTFNDLGNFAKEELPSQFDVNTINRVYTPEYQAKYNQLYNEARDIGIDVWDKQGIEHFQSQKNMDTEQANLFSSRVSLHGKLGSNEDFLGNGLTKNLIESSNNQYGVVETFTFEHTPQNLAALKENGAISIIDNLKPIY